MTGPASAPDAWSVLTEWRPDFVVLAVAAVVGIAAVRATGTARQAGVHWPRHREVVFWAGFAAAVWATNGFLQARSFQLMWVWMVQDLVLLLVVPIVVMAAQPLTLLSAAYGPDNPVARLLGSRLLRFVGSPLVSPVLVPVLCVLLIFGGLGEFSVSSGLAAALVHLLLVAVGMLIAIPLVSTDDQRSSLAVGLSLGVGFVELVLDAFPGIALRFQTHLTLLHFATGRPLFSPVGIDDQHIAGGVLWVVAEVLDLPFLILAATRWIRADARDAARIDAELDARVHWATDGEQIDAPVLERPWWLEDPSLRDRLRADRPRIDRPRTDRPRMDRPRTDRPRTDRVAPDSLTPDGPAPDGRNPT